MILVSKPRSAIALAICLVALVSTVIVLGGASNRANEAPSDWPTKLVLGLVPSEGSADIVERFKPMAAHLERVLGIKIESMSASDYAGVITAMSHKHVDFAYLGPKSYVEAASRANAVAVALELNEEGVPGYHGLIIARKDRAFTKPDDIKGKTFAFTDPNSTSGYLVPLMYFKRDLGTDPKQYFKEVRFAGSHQAAILAVINGSVDAAATNDLDLARVVKSGQVKQDDLAILWKSELIPGAPMVVRKDLPESLKAAFIGAMMTLNDDKAALAHLGNGGFIYTNDSAYDVMRYLMRLQSESAEAK